MKNFKFFAVAMVFAICSMSAPDASAQRILLTPTVDTVNNATTMYVNVPTGSIVTLGGHKSWFTVSLTATKISGTVGGTATLESTVNGTTWQKFADSVYTITNTAGTQEMVWPLNNWNRYNMRIKIVTSGTQSWIPLGYLLMKNW